MLLRVRAIRTDEGVDLCMRVLDCVFLLLFTRQIRVKSIPRLMAVLLIMIDGFRLSVDTLVSIFIIVSVS